MLSGATKMSRGINGRPYTISQVPSRQRLAKYIGFQFMWKSCRFFPLQENSGRPLPYCALVGRFAAIGGLLLQRCRLQGVAPTAEV